MTPVKYQYDELMNPVLSALKLLGGSGTNEEINDKVAELVQIPSQQLEILHNPEKGGMTEIEYRLMWTRTYLKKYGLLENSSRGVWSLTQKGSSLEKVNENEVVRYVRELTKKDKEVSEQDEDEPNKKVVWQEELLEIILKMSPSAFERLIQRLLREAGFVQVEVTGQSGDGGIDGHGILRLGGLLSFHVIFQAKRWKGSVGTSQVRDFRGAMVGRADKGLLITTGAFTKDAIKEATRDGAPAIDLVDGDQLVEKLKLLSLGVETKAVMMEQVSVNKDWFAHL
ncbi:MAG: restriction endonuclease [Candidatus Atribacteria bacterium]|nr:restriction endonuclease [Candidatus Atribacteria bacterium]